MIKVLIVDDHVVMRKGLKQLCASMGDVTVDGEAANGDEALEALQHGQFDLVLLDLSMPGLSGADLVERIHALYADLPILIFSMRDEALLAKRVLQKGASGFVCKGSGEEMLIGAIRKVAAGIPFADPFIVEQMLFEQPATGETRTATQLSQRELEIMKLLGQGKSVSAIADELCINSRTVSTHKARLMQKMHFKSNADLVRYTVESGLLDAKK
ncbi:MAG TPA: response regulator transcription factor [Gallionella sp.]|nr:response regulator transcription factor [Gallionella sp.]